MTHMQVSVDSKGNSKIKFVDGIELPTGTRTSKGPRETKYDFSDAQIGRSYFFTTRKEANAAVQAFHKNMVNEEARTRCRPTMRDLAKYKDLPRDKNIHGLGLPGREFGIWMKALKVKVEKTA